MATPLKDNELVPRKTQITPKHPRKFHDTPKVMLLH